MAKMNSVPFTEQQKILLKELLRAGAVLTGEKTVLDYLLKPILKVRNRALRER